MTNIKLSKKDFELKLVKDFPIIYRDMYGDPRETCMSFGLEIRPGWHDIVYNCSLLLENIAKQQPLPTKQNFNQKILWPYINKYSNMIRSKKFKVPNFYWDNIYSYFEPPQDARLKFSQIKEKFGTLRLYTNFSSKEVDNIIDEAEKASGITCERCGDAGSMRKKKGYYFTSCEVCYAR